MKLNYKKMVEDIDALVNNDSVYEFMGYPKTFTKKQAAQMSELIGKVYLISHCISCKACRVKYLPTK